MVTSSPLRHATKKRRKKKKRKSARNILDTRSLFLSFTFDFVRIERDEILVSFHFLVCSFVRLLLERKVRAVNLSTLDKRKVDPWNSISLQYRCVYCNFRQIKWIDVQPCKIRRFFIYLFILLFIYYQYYYYIVRGYTVAHKHKGLNVAFIYFYHYCGYYNLIFHNFLKRDNLRNNFQICTVTSSSCVTHCWTSNC